MGKRLARYNLYMRSTVIAIGDQLASAIRALGVNFIMGGHGVKETLHTRPARLLKALAQSEEARLRLSLIPLFLEHPEYAAHVRAAARQLDPAARLTLLCYYTAAVWLAKKHRLRVAPLPDVFSEELGLNPVENPEANLQALTARHHNGNWLATYQHAEQVWCKGLE
jgi:hypothetical protein